VWISEELWVCEHDFCGKVVVGKGEHGNSLFIMFMNFKKAFDSVPRSSLWSVLVKCLQQC